MASEVIAPEAFMAAARIAKADGVRVADVLARYRRGVQKSEITFSTFFYGGSDISLPRKKTSRRSSDGRRAASCGAARGNRRKTLKPTTGDVA